MPASRSTPTSEEYLTAAEAAALLKIKRQRLAQLRRAGVFLLGVHFTRPAGMRPRWLKSALEAHLRSEPIAQHPGRASPRRSRSRLNTALVR